MKRVISIALCLSLFFGIASIAQAAPANRGCKPTGNGTIKSPYTLCYAQDFEKIRSHPSAHFQLAQNIDFSGTPSWEPIPEFSGSLDGRHLAIVNLWSEKNGLFLISNGDIKDLSLRNANINGGDGVAALAQTNYGTIVNVTVEGNIHAERAAGGIVAVNYGVIERSSTTGWVTAQESGAAGFVHDNYGTITRSRSTSNTYGPYVYGPNGATGFVYINSSGGKIMDCQAGGHSITFTDYGSTFAIFNYGTILRSSAFGNIYSVYSQNQYNTLGLFIPVNLGTVQSSNAFGKFLPIDAQPQW